MGFDGYKLPHFKGNKKGRLYLTTHRVSEIMDETKIYLQKNKKDNML